MASILAVSPAIDMQHNFMNPLHSILHHGQSIWYDYISRDFITSGKMKELVDSGIRGMTSNPTIFEKAIAGSTDYDQQIKELADNGNSLEDIANQLFITDVRDACDIMRPVYDSADGKDGFISIEVNPKLASKTEETISEARHLWNTINRPNLMIKIPATPEGLPAIRQCIAEGISVNITLMFSLEQYRRVAEAYIYGLEDRLSNGGDISAINSVASVFVSRIDGMIDSMLSDIGTPEALALRGKAGLANTKLVYQEYKRIFNDERWEELKDKHANAQRPLWASTSTKDPSYPDLLYVDNIIGPDTVNTVPPATLEAIMDHADVDTRIEEGVVEAQKTMEDLAAVGIDIDDVMARLLNEGVEKFEQSFDSLFDKLREKRDALVASTV